MESKFGNRNKEWRKALIDAEKAVIKVELDAIKDSKKLKKHLMQRIVELEEELSSVGQLKRFIYCFYALLNHRKSPLFSPDVVRKIAGLLAAILKTQRISPKTSELAFLHRDFHLLMSQIYWKDGDIWNSAWQQQMAFYSSSEKSEANRALELLSTGLRAARLGQGRTTLTHLAEAEAIGLGTRDFILARLERIRTYRLSGEMDTAFSLIETTLKEEPVSKEVRLELEWERELCQLRKNEDLTRLVGLLRRGKSHNHASYLLDGYLWSRCVPDRQWLKRFKSAGEMGRRASSEMKKFGFYFKAVNQIKECYDYEIPFTLRLEKIEELLENLHRLPSIERELLVLAAIARWLSRSRSYSFAFLVLGEYEGLSLRISQGKVHDALGIMNDLLFADWFQKKAA